MNHYLVISALGKDRPGIVNSLSSVILEAGCNIVDSRMTVLGGEFAIILLISGAEDAVRDMQGRIAALENELSLTIHARETEERAAVVDMLPYAVGVVSMDHPGIVHRVADFFSSRQINIEDLSTDSYAAPHTGTPMFSMKMSINVPASMQIAGLRQQFADFCDGLNLDGTLEPEKT
jgi:glycine cleavage system transcriptional repressor